MALGALGRLQTLNKAPICVVLLNPHKVSQIFIEQKGKLLVNIHSFGHMQVSTGQVGTSICVD